MLVLDDLMGNPGYGSADIGAGHHLGHAYGSFPDSRIRL
jgi:hypothetical protein